ncbi:MAG TPA: hypothetical protein VG711_12495 [Phycisphaerales bacterium]|nr:hypothetical protein [Phycisphaerales bacterium]
MTILNSTSRVRSFRTSILAACAVLMAFAAVPAAHASGRHGNDDAPRIIRKADSHFSISIRIGADRHDDLASFEARESRRQFEAGMAQGARDGFNAGYQDAIRHQRFDDCLHLDLCRVNASFASGYRDAYARAYASGYAQAQRDACRPVYRRPVSCR